MAMHYDLDAGEPVAGDARSDTDGPSVIGARSWLFVPGDRPDRFIKAATSGADMVICDLEDGVSASRKIAARDSVVSWLRAEGLACVRINPPQTAWMDDELSMLAGLAGLRAVMVPKAEDPRVFRTLHETLGPKVAIVALVETALGIHRAFEIATAPGVTRLAFGSIDFALDINASEEATSLLLARSLLVVSSRAAGLPPPVDGVTVKLREPQTVHDDSAHAASLGFGGKLCVHPSQVGIVNAAFLPSEEQLRWARSVVQQTADGAATDVGGQLVDAPVLTRARRILDRMASRAPSGVKD